MSRERWMALLFAAGSACFLVGPFPGYVELVGPEAVGVTFFAGSILFTAGGALQTWLALPGRRSAGPGRAAWRAAAVQSAGTLFFNVTTFQGMHTALTDPHYDRLVWRPDALGSICFLVSGAIAYRASERHPRPRSRRDGRRSAGTPVGLGRRPARGGPGWWQPAVNLLGCVFFGVSAVAGYVVPETGSMVDLAWANWNTAAGAACFLACALGGLAREPIPDDGLPRHPERMPA
jgi:hypothetical protein